MYRRHRALRRGLASRVRPRQPQLPHRRDRMHWRTAPLGVPGRAARQGVQVAESGSDPASGARLIAPGDPMSSLLRLPLFPLHTVLFPGGRLPLRIFEQRYIEMTKASACATMHTSASAGSCDGDEVRPARTPSAGLRVRLATLARIENWDMPEQGILQRERRRRNALRRCARMRRERTASSSRMCRRLAGGAASGRSARGSGRSRNVAGPPRRPRGNPGNFRAARSFDDASWVGLSPGRATAAAGERSSRTCSRSTTPKCGSRCWSRSCKAHGLL